MNIVSLLDQHARNDPSAPAIVGGRAAFSYGELSQMSAAFARTLMDQHRVNPRDRVGLVLPNTVEFVVAFLGIMRLGAIPVPMNTRLRDHDLGPLLEQVHARVVVADESRATALTAFDLIRADSILETLDLDAEWVPCHAQQWSDVSNIVFTSGSTSQPKAVLQTHGMHMSTGAALADFLQLSRHDATALLSPMFHVAGLTMLATALTLGCRFTLHSGWQREQALADIDAHGVTFVHLVGAVFLDILNGERAHPSGRRFAQLRHVLMGGAVVDADRLRWFEHRFGCTVIGAYGRTEGGKAWCAPSAASRWTAHGIVNRNVCDIRIVDPATEAELAPGMSGEIRVKGDGVSAGYDGDPSLTAAVLDAAGWMKTGDQGFIDEEGVLHFSGRADGMIKTGGENVSPQEVERALVQIPGVAEAVVVGIPHERLGQTVAALVVGDASLHADGIQQESRNLLAGFKIPRVVKVDQALPRLASQKVDMNAVRAILIEQSNQATTTTTSKE